MHMRQAKLDTFHALRLRTFEHGAYGQQHKGQAPSFTLLHSDTMRT